MIAINNKVILGTDKMIFNGNKNREIKTHLI